MNIVLLPSFDYEIFHGRNFFDATETLFGPTARILARSNREGIPVTLFADTMSVDAHEQSGQLEFRRRFDEQLQDAVRSGHDVQVHIHAHWAAARYAGGEWVLDEPRVTLDDFGFDSGRPQRFIGQSVAYLQNLLRPIDPAYDCVAFRAGGLALQPNEHQLILALLEAGLSIDSSIAKRLELDMDTVKIDYRGLPSAPNWLIAPESGIASHATGGLFEIPICTFTASKGSTIGFLLRRARAIRKRKGSGLSRARKQTRLANGASLVRENLRYLSSRPTFLFSADTKGFSRRMLVQGFHDYVRAHESAGADVMYVSMINHPKLMFKEEETLLFNVLNDLRCSYGSRLRFATYRDVAAEIATKEAVHA